MAKARINHSFAVARRKAIERITNFFNAAHSQFGNGRKIKVTLNHVAISITVKRGNISESFAHLIDK